MERRRERIGEEREGGEREERKREEKGMVRKKGKITTTISIWDVRKTPAIPNYLCSLSSIVIAILTMHIFD